jgi:hypothetical protein
MSEIAAFWVHTATVETFLGAGPRGDTYAPPVTVMGFLDDGVVLVQSGAGEQLVQKSIFYGPLTFTHEGVQYLSRDVFVAESQVTVNGKVAQVSETHLRDGASLGLPDHIEVHFS